MKNKIFVLAILMLLVSSFAVNAVGFSKQKTTANSLEKDGGELPQIECGDVLPYDGITMDDAWIVARAAAGIGTPLGAVTESIGDVNSDGHLTILDALIIMRRAQGITTEPLSCPYND